MLIDAHTHVGKYLFIDTRERNRGWDIGDHAKQLLSYMDDLGVAVSVVSNTAGLYYDYRKGNDDLSRIVRKYPRRLVGLATVRPRLDDYAEELERAITKLGLNGLKLHAAIQQFSIDEIYVDRVMEKAEELDIPVLFHTGTTAGSNPILLGKVAEKHPNLTLIAAHTGQ